MDRGFVIAEAHAVCAVHWNAGLMRHGREPADKVRRCVIWHDAAAKDAGSAGACLDCGCKLLLDPTIANGHDDKVRGPGKIRY